jgi:hypothetical protein
MNCLNHAINNDEDFKAHKGTNHEDLDKDTQAQVPEKAEQAFLACVMIQLSVKSNINLKMDLHNAQTMGTNNYPKSPPESLHSLDHCLKQAASQALQPQSHSFAQGGRRSGCGRGWGQANLRKIRKMNKH